MLDDIIIGFDNLKLVECRHSQFVCLHKQLLEFISDLPLSAWLSSLQQW